MYDMILWIEQYLPTGFARMEGIVRYLRGFALVLYKWLVVSLHFYSNNYKSYQKALKKPYLPTLIYEPSPSTKVQVFSSYCVLPKNME